MIKAPPISRDLLEYLEKVFSPARIHCLPSTPTHEITAKVHRDNGVYEVVSHLRATYEEQQNEDPINVS